MNRIAIVCESMTGNTMMLSEALRSHLQSRKIPVLKPSDADPDAYDTYLVGSWTNKGDCGPQTAAFLAELQTKDVFIFGTCGFGATEAYYESIYHRVAAHLKPDNRILGHFICQGKMPADVLVRFEALKQANPDCTRWDGCIAHYNQALSHPDRQDLISLCETAERCLQQTDSSI